MLEKQHQIQKRRRERRKSSNNRGIESSPENATPSDNPSAIPHFTKESSDTESESRTSLGKQESGYSSGSVDSRLPDSDSEMSSPDRERPPIGVPIGVPGPRGSEDLSLEEELMAVDRLKLDKLEVEERLGEMEKVVLTLQAENRRLQTIFASSGSEATEAISMQDSFRSVDDEVQDVQDVRY